MQRICINSWCAEAFEITDDDLACYKKLAPVIGGQTHELPLPDFCFSCRLQRRLAFYNSRSLYKRICDFSGKQVVSVFSPDKPFKVYDKDIWFSDAWNPLSYGRDFDFDRPFFSQFRELMEAVPQLAITHFGWENINSEFTNDNYKIKNCYLTFDGEQAEDCYYLHSFVMDKNCVDGVHLMLSELCYECVHCTQCYALRFARYSNNCSDSEFLRDCIGCKNCFGCANLRQKQYCIWNEQKTKQEYETFLQSFESSSHDVVQAMRKKAEDFFSRQPVKSMRGEQNQNVVGDNMNQSKNAHWCFDCYNQEDCRYTTNCMMPAKDLFDVHVWGDGLELAYDCCVIGADSRELFFDYAVASNCTDILYSTYCSQGCSHCFGCVGLRRSKYCIFNQQYSEEEYGKLVNRIIDHMRQAGEWGRFFPSEYSFFGYNETMAQTFFPLTKEECKKRGYRWCDYEAAIEATRTIPAAQLPDNSADIPDDILNWAIVCEVSKKPFKIIKQELDFYRTHRLSIPRRHPNQRHFDRYALKNPFKLFDRTCAKCSKAIQTSYAPDRPEIVYCEECYLKEVY